MSVQRSLKLAAAILVLTTTLIVPGCEPSSVFEVDEFGEINFNVDLTGIPAEDSDDFRIHWQHTDWEDIQGGQTFHIFDPPNDYDIGLLEQVPVGPVRLSLTRVPPNCTVTDSDPEKTVTVRQDQTASVTFTVACS